MRLDTVLTLLVLGSCSLWQAQAASTKPPLKRSEGKRWQHLADIVHSEIKTATHKFMHERGQQLFIPTEVDVLLLGFEGDGAFHYDIKHEELEELLSSQFRDQHLCPTIVETGHMASTCATVSYVTLRPPNPTGALKEIETAIRANLRPVTLPVTHIGAPDEPKDPVYEVDASLVENAFLNVLAQTYHSEGFMNPSHHDPDHPSPEDLYPPNPLEHRAAIIIINPAKQRMNPLVTPEQGEATWRQYDVRQEWGAGRINSSRLHEYEAGFNYRYNYGGKGASSTWVSAHNFVVLDLSSGPVSYGPVLTLSNTVTPTNIPRIAPMLESLAHEVEDAHQVTLHQELVQEAVAGHTKLLLGEVAATVASATQFLIAPDIALNTLELAKTVLVNLIVLSDHDQFDLLDGRRDFGPVDTEIDMAAVHTALAAMIPSDMSGVVMPRSASLRSYPGVLSALAKARVSWSDPVMREPPHTGLHHTQHSRLDSQLLMEELKEALPYLAPLHETIDADDQPAGHLAISVRHNGTRTLNVVVLSLMSAPTGMLFENGQLVAMSNNLVVVIQLVESVQGMTSHSTTGIDATERAEDKLKLYSGHMQDGVPVEMDGAGSVTARVIAGMCTSLGGLTFPWELVDPLRGTMKQDWRWAVGCVPYGPYGNCTRVSKLFVSTIRRNHLVSHVQSALQAVQYRMDAVDQVVSYLAKGPWTDLVRGLVNRPSGVPPVADPRAADPDAEVVGHMSAHEQDLYDLSQRQEHGPRYWLDVLGKQMLGGFTESAVRKIDGYIAEIEADLSGVAWAIFSKSTWDQAIGYLDKMLHHVDEFTLDIDPHIQECQEAAGCCKLHHSPLLFMDLTVMIIFGIVLLVFACVAFAVLANKKIYRPPAPKPYASYGGTNPYGAPDPPRRMSSSGGAKGLLPLFGGEANKFLPR